MQRLTNLPGHADVLIGRDADIASLTQLLVEHRLVTVLGAGGIGKTRLAQAVSRRLVGAYANGVWWVDLAALSAASGCAAVS
jgi:predicted ATPase